MLRVKYFEKFKGDNPFLVVISDKQGLSVAYHFFKDKQGAFLNDSAVTEFSKITPLDADNLFLNSNECQEIAQHFKNLDDANEPGHAYLDTEALGDEIEMIISYGEYNGLF